MQICIIDGLNLIRISANCVKRSFEEEDSDSAKMIDILNKSKSTKGYKKEVYFDGPKRPIYNNEQLTDIIFSRHKKADDLIVNSVAEYTQNYSVEKVIVVTSDTELANRCKSYGAEIISARRFMYSWLDCPINC